MPNQKPNREHGADVVVGDKMAFKGVNPHADDEFIEFDVEVIELDYRRGYRRFKIRPKSGYGTMIVERDVLKFA